MYSIQEAGGNDIAKLRDLVYQVWPQTYAGIISQEQIDYMLEMMYSASSLQKQMDDGALFIFLVENDQYVGYASYQQTDPGVFKLHKIYVLPSEQGKGAGRFMIDYVISKVKEQGGNRLQLQVNRGNKARYFYEKLGFQVIGSFDFDIGKGFVMDDYVMELSFEI